jgi:EAL domain-containing protein (putative c-di-GMP-specific phosphodiesterase class I)
MESFAPHLVFLDLTFPEMDGLSVLSELTPRNPGIAVVLVSGCDPEVLRSAHRIGERIGLSMLPPLNKPVTAAHIRDVLTLFESEGHGITPASVDGALTKGILGLHYQPQIGLRDGRYHGVEALVRWPVAGGGSIAPGQFIPVVERDEGLSLRLLCYVLDRAIEDAPAWHGDGARCALNMSALCLTEDRLPDRLCARLRGGPLTPADFTLELTETAALRDPDRVDRVLTALRIRGFAVSLDDFGTGHSSLLHLQRMPFNEIKIDRQFVSTLTSDHRSRQIVELMVGLGRTLGATTVAEGIETPEEVTELRGIACDVGQGYVLARPMTADALKDWRAQWQSGTQWATASGQPEDPTGAKGAMGMGGPGTRPA